MTLCIRMPLAFVSVLVLVLGLAADASAQLWPNSGPPFQLPSPRTSGQASPVTADEMPGQVLSGNPIGYLIGLYNAEYEVRAGRFVTFGAGASRLGWGPDGFDHNTPYLNGDVFLRYYPGGEAFNGIAVGVKAGYTQLPGSGRFLGLGFDANHSLMLNRHFYMGTGLGLKRLLRQPDGGLAIRYIPTLRFNVGVGF